MKCKVSLIVLVLIFLLLWNIGLKSTDNNAVASPYDVFECGDINNSGSINILDITYTVAYLYRGGPPPPDTLLADVNSSGGINILDITYLIGYLYQGGMVPDCPEGEDPEPEDSLPATFDLRNVEGVNYVTSVKNQTGGTCWAHATMASAEGNLMMTNAWTDAGEAGEPNLAEYHLDWWNGFNDHWDPDDDPWYFVEVHDGGTYQMSSAYFSRGDGAVRDIDGQSYSPPPDHFNDSYHRFYVRDIEWYSGMITENEPQIELIKRKLMENGAIATCMSTQSQYMYPGNIYYVPPEDWPWIDHTVTIVGWNDNIVTPAPEPGAWLCKNSWGEGWGYDGYFWGSYYDRVMGRDPELGAVAFLNIEPLAYDCFHFHDYHGWTYNSMYTNEAFNAFTTENNEILQAVNFVTLEDSIDYTVTIYDTYNGVELFDPLATVSGIIEIKGYHTIDLPSPLELSAGNDFYIYLHISNYYMAYDASTYVKNIPGAKSGAYIESKSEPGQSFYKSDKDWLDLYKLDNSANFCIKGLGYQRSLKVLPSDGVEFQGAKGGPFTPTGKSYKFTHKYLDPIDYQVSANPVHDWLVVTGDLSGTLALGDTAEVTVTIDETETVDIPEGLYTVSLLFENLYDPADDEIREIQMVLGTSHLYYQWTLDSDPGWSCEGDWAFGQPTGEGGTFGFGADPSSGFTGDNVYGYNLYGNYPLLLEETHLTTGPIDCEKLLKVRLKFQRWLASDGFGVGYVRISNDGTNWTTVWQGYDGTTDLDWTATDIDIADLATFDNSIYLRWTMYVDDGAMYTFGGWNLDDVEIWAIYDSVSVIPPSATGQDGVSIIDE